MTNRDGTGAKTLAPTMVSLLFLCHIAGVFCLMVPPSGTGEPSLQSPPSTQSMMAGDAVCSDAIHSAGDRADMPKMGVSSAAAILAPAAVPVSTPPVSLVPDPPHTGPPLYTRLSTFRI